MNPLPRFPFLIIQLPILHGDCIKLIFDIIHFIRSCSREQQQKNYIFLLDKLVENGENGFVEGKKEENQKRMINNEWENVAREGRGVSLTSGHRRLLMKIDRLRIFLISIIVYLSDVNNLRQSKAQKLFSL